jgi:N-acetylmuramoyl-L-alanine amidase
VIVIDPGHGGVDPGAIGRTTGVYEKTIALNAARILRDRLEKTGRFRVHLTRDSDMFLRLQERVGIARAHNADLFISIHADANPILSVQGLSVYTLSNDASDREAEALAQRENKADLIAGVDLSEERPELINILLDLALRETMNLSARYANMLIDDLAGRTTLLRRSHRFAGFAVLKAPDVPSVLIELGHLSNAEDERLLQRRAHLEAIADGIVKATERFFDYRIALRRS